MLDLEKTHLLVATILCAIGYHMDNYTQDILLRLILFSRTVTAHRCRILSQIGSEVDEAYRNISLKVRKFDIEKQHVKKNLVFHEI